MKFRYYSLIRESLIKESPRNFEFEIRSDDRIGVAKQGPKLLGPRRGRLNAQRCLEILRFRLVACRSEARWRVNFSLPRHSRTSFRVFCTDKRKKLSKNKNKKNREKKRESYDLRTQRQMFRNHYTIFYNFRTNLIFFRK